jgi:hypothetical protein
VHTPTMNLTNDHKCLSKYTAKGCQPTNDKSLTIDHKHLWKHRARKVNQNPPEPTKTRQNPLEPTRSPLEPTRTHQNISRDHQKPTPESHQNPTLQPPPEPTRVQWRVLTVSGAFWWVLMISGLFGFVLTRSEIAFGNSFWYLGPHFIIKRTSFLQES